MCRVEAAGKEKGIADEMEAHFSVRSRRQESDAANDNNVRHATQNKLRTLQNTQ